MPEVPDLSKEQIERLTRICFRQNSKEVPQVDLIFIFGTAVCFKELGIALKKVLHCSNQILFTGGIERYVDSIVHERPESEMLYDEVKSFIPKQTKVFIETKSRNTFENLELGLKLLDKMPESVCFIVKSFHSGRAYMTLKKFLPKAVIYQDSFDSIYPNQNDHMTADSWHLNKQYRARVWGEFLRIKQYGKRKDLDFGEVQDLLNEIDPSDRISS